MEELPQDRLATTDETGRRVYLYPAAVAGFFRRRRNIVHAALVLLFLALPWIRHDGRQLLLLNVAKREFYLFGLHLRAHDAPLILFVLLGFTFLIGLLTALYGRVWCGWACPQTVFIEGVYRRIETWIEGNPRERKALDDGPWDTRKLFLKAAKYSAFAGVTLVITHSLLAYFVGGPELIAMVSSPPGENWAAFLLILGTSAILLLDFGWFREQFCVVMCPYGRFQSVLLDNRSLVVAYDAKRGEPRGKANTPGAGDCVNCFRCVQVCPTGVDIRRGLQMECIACTACIDACDSVMEKLNRPTGLIRYTTQDRLDGKTHGWLRPRVLAYAALTTLVTGALAFSLGQKEYFELTLLRAKTSPYQILQVAGAPVVLNQLRLHVSNQTGQTQTMEMLAPELPGLELVIPQNPRQVADEEQFTVDFFLKFSPSLLERGSRPTRLSVRHGEATTLLEVTLVGPER